MKTEERIAELSAEREAEIRQAVREVMQQWQHTVLPPQRSVNLNDVLSFVTMFALVFGLGYNAFILHNGGTVMACDHIYQTAKTWPVLAFALGVLFGATVLDWLREHPWFALVATFSLGHCLWPIR